MSAQFSTPTDELLLLAETLGEVKSRTEKLETEFSTQAKPLEAATNALSAALSGIKALQFHVLDNNLGALSARVEEMRKAVDEQVGVIALELKKADETNAAKAGADADALRAEIVALQSQLGSLVTQFGQQLERVEFAAKEEAKKLQLIPGPAGAAGASLNPRGTFIDGETYNRLDVVSWLGSSYIATVDGVTEKPSKNSNQWQTLASRGGGGGGGVGDFGSLAGVAQINQGGTGQTTRAAALNALLPSQAGNTQYMLLTDGSGTVSWGAQPVAGLPSQTSNSGKLLTTDGTNASWSGAVTVSGNNATIAGNLTVSGNIASVGASGSGTGGGVRLVDDGGTSRWLAGLLGTAGARDYVIYDSVTPRQVIGISATSGVVSLSGTTASTSTSTGALVVSGGLGVGGAAFFGGNATVFGAAGITINNVGGSGNDSILTLTQSGVSNAFIKNTATTGDIAIGDGGGTYLRITKGAGVVFVSNTTASTSTSSGALVVSGGVGVAGAIYGGGVINTSVGTGGVGNQLVLNNSATNATSGRGSAIVYTGTGDANLAAIESQTATASNNTGKLVIKTSNAGTLAVAATYDENGNLIQKVNGTAPSLAVNSTMTFELTSNTSLKIFVRGSDGTTRSTTLTLA